MSHGWDFGLDRKNFLSTYAILFFGVLNRGIKLSFIKVIVQDQYNEGLISGLRIGSPLLKGISREFQRVYNFTDSVGFATAEFSCRVFLQPC
jgi:hypothetical protein